MDIEVNSSTQAQYADTGLQAQFYVDATLGNDGTPGTIGLPWKTIAKVNSSKFNPGDSIYFKKAETWREQLTVPSSGTSGNPITFSTYGSGAKPKISAADAPTFTAVTAATPTSSDGFEVGDPDLTNGDGAYWGSGYAGGASFVGNATDVVDSGTYSAKIISNSGQNAQAQHTITQVNDNYEQYRFYVDSMTASATNEVQLRTLSYGLSIRIYPRLKYVTSTTFTLNLYYQDSTGEHSVNGTHTFNTGTWYTLEVRYFVDASAGVAQMWVNGISEAVATSLNTSFANSQPNKVSVGIGYMSPFTTITAHFDNVKYHTSYIGITYPNVWSGALAASPRRIWFSGTRGGAAQASVAALDAQNEWYWSGGTLYVYSTTDPSGTVEADNRAKCIDTNGKSYLTLENLQTWYASATAAGDNIFATGNASNITFDGVDSNYSYRSAYYFTGDGSANSISAVTIKNGTITGNDKLAEETPTGAFIFADGSDGFGTDGMTIQNMTITGGNDATSNHGIGIWFSQTNANVTVTGNTIHDLYGHGVDLTTYITGTFAVSGTNLIENNTIYNVGYGFTQSYAGIAVGSDAPATRPFSGVTVRYNSINNVGAMGIIAWGTGTSNIYYNKISNIGKFNAASAAYPAGINVVAAQTALGFYNNAILVGTSPGTNQNTNGIFLDTGAINVTVKNNIVYGSSYYLVWAKEDYTGDYNDYYAAGGPGNFSHGSTVNFADFKTATGQEAHSITSDPVFVSIITPDFNLQYTSPCINAGTDVSLTRDFKGNPVPYGIAPDIGVYEWTQIALDAVAQVQSADAPILSFVGTFFLDASGQIQTSDGIDLTLSRYATLSGTVTATINASDIILGGKTIILTLTGDTWIV